MITDFQPDMNMPGTGSCVPQETVIKDVKLAHAYVPFQKMCATYMPLEGLIMGTIFPPLTGLYSWERKRMGDDMYE
jgi:hypothetical protein